MSEITNNNIYTLLESAAKESPERLFFSFEKQNIDYKSGCDRVNRLAAYFKSRDVQKGDRVIIHLPNVPEFVYSLMALAQLGAIAVLIGPVARRFEIEYMLKETQPKLIITSVTLLDHYTIDNTFFIDLSKVWLPDEKHPARGFEGIMEKTTPLTEVEAITGDESVAIIYTSAMEGYPGGVELSHRGIIGSTKILASYVTEDDVWFAGLPLFHAFGLTVSVITPLQTRTRFHLIKRFSPTTLVKEINKQGITVMPGVPKMFMMVNAMLPPGEHFPNLKVCICGGEGISKETIIQLKEKYNLDVREGYGLTEASPVITWNHTNTENRPGSVGPVMPWNEIRIVDEKNQDVKTGETGEILVKGINVTKGYYHKPEKTEKSFTDGWLHTGDYGYQDEDGYVYITGLKKSMLLSSAFNVYPAEVERILGYHPFIEEARLEVVEDQQKGDIVRHFGVAHVTLKAETNLTENELQLWCKDNLSTYKLPKKFIISQKHKA